MPTQNTQPQVPVKWLPLLLASSVVLGMFVGLRLQNEPLLIPKKSQTQAGIDPLPRSFQEMVRFLDARYVDPVNKDSFNRLVLEKALTLLDPYSTYLDPENTKASDDELRGAFNGVGIVFKPFKDTLHVMQVFESSPAQKAGIRAGDRLISINNVLVAGKNQISNNKDSTWLVPEGRPLELRVLRPEQGIKSYTIDRSELVVPCIESAYLIDKQTGYIKIRLFNANTYQEFFDKAKKFSSSGVRDLIIDLRGNPGGYLEESYKILNEFFKEKGKLLFYTAGRSEQKIEYYTDGRSVFDFRRIVVIIDEHSASASEILAGALQDWDRGAVVGVPSFGKGMVQNQFELEQGGSLRISTARFYLPTGRCVQRPYLQFDRERAGYASDTMIYRTPAGRKVRGGQGIQPDHPLKPENTSREDDELFTNAAEEFIYLNYPQLKKGLPDSFKTFRTGYTVSKDLFERFVRYVMSTSGKNTLSLDDILQNKSDITILLKANLAKFHYNSEAYFMTLNENDRFVRKAYEVIKSGDPFN